MQKNITLSADEVLIQQARQRAMREQTTLNDLFRAWLQQYVAQPNAAERYAALMSQLEHINAGGTFTRDELNERR